MFKDIYEELPEEGEDTNKHIKALSDMVKNSEHKELFDHLYECLSILDNKSSSLLSFNSIILAVYAIFMIGKNTFVETIFLGLVMAFLLASSLSLLKVVWVHWSTTDHLCDSSKHAQVLLKVRKERTIKYRKSWYFSAFSLLCLISFIFFKIIFHS